MGDFNAIAADERAEDDVGPSAYEPKWMRTFSEGRFTMRDGSRFGKSLTACGDAGVAAVQQSLPGDGRNSCEEIAEDVLISKSSVYRVLRDKLDKRKMFSK
ncbi:histone-lysine N-methyltransferase SETMAR-like protein [Plakobranchus ocellatus]|uniref:Histone-lysine N-methyltransferase SETMAR-like protein n=1 Tax=Plakobranchus ocellatus TaxID=259542 RepID=A0AAV3Z8T0_9GAST|nr:histone-lysine N-methyltransferase SETMAR-like protein [Plakobranchus ocellatus]